MQKKYLSAIIAAFIGVFSSSSSFAAWHHHWSEEKDGGVFERGYNKEKIDELKWTFCSYYHNSRTHGATSQTDKRPGTSARVCAGHGGTATSRSQYRNIDTWHPYYHFCQDQHGGKY